MGKEKRWTYATASKTARAERSIGIVRVTGILTGDTLGLVLADNAAWLGEQSVEAQVADYTGASLCINPEAMLARADAVLKVDGALATPTALVVQKDLLQHFNTYAWLMAQRGVIRGVFERADEAQRWVGQQARVLEVLRRERAAAWGLAEYRPSASRTDQACQAACSRRTRAQAAAQVRSGPDKQPPEPVQ